MSPAEKAAAAKPDLEVGQFSPELGAIAMDESVVLVINDPPESGWTKVNRQQIAA